ncbi:MAG: hypothetical protein LBS75_09680 [Synergistaceae bacterium]|nr:hypothetical protein [Synergistaceae bacterium]
MDRFAVSIIQLDASESNARRNVERALDAAGSMSEMPNLLMLPELWTGSRAAPGESRSALASLSALCAARGIHAVAGTMPWPSGDGVANRAWAVDDLGRGYAFYDKVHLSSKEGENERFKPGCGAGIFDAGGVVCAVMTSYDMLFPEFHRPIALAGARIFFVASRWCDEANGVWEITARATAAWNQAFVVACNRTGETEDGKFHGNSMIVSPSGDVLGRLGREEGVLSVLLDLGEIKRTRRNLSIESDRRSDIYTILS